MDSLVTNQFQTTNFQIDNSSHFPSLKHPSLRCGKMHGDIQEVV